MANGTGCVRMAKAKKTKPCERLVRWRISMITPAKFVDFTLAPDQATAERQVAEAHDICEDLHDGGKRPEAPPGCCGKVGRNFLEGLTAATRSTAPPLAGGGPKRR
jgi:hypothetical protein